MAKWTKTTFPGVRYREHETRKHGVKFDQYFTIRYKRDGKDKEEGLGWASEGWTAKKAYERLAAIKRNIRDGQGPQTLAEKRELEKAAREQAEQENITFGHYFENEYSPTSKIGKKKGTTRKESEHFKKWIEPVIGNIPLKDVKPFAIEKIKKNVLSAGNAPRTLQYIFATIRQAWNMARRDGLVMGDSPTKLVKVPKIDNKRVRFLSHKEAESLLSALEGKDALAHDMALVSLHSGLRFGEIAALKWSHIDTDRGIITVMDPKGVKGRAAFMTARMQEMFKGMKRRGPDGYVFPKRYGESKNDRLNEPPKAFSIVVKDLKLNEGIEDRRQKVSFHTLRHTFASWHAEAGTDLYTLKELMGHSVIAMTERYAHLGNGTLQNATRTLEEAIKRAEQKEEGQAEQAAS